MLLIGKQLIEEKHRLYIVQNGICPLCKRNLNDDVVSNHLDHDHALVGDNSGRVRSLLCCYCNALEGQIKHKFNSSGLNSRGVDIQEWIHSLSEYYSADITKNRIHPAYIGDKTKWFSRLNKDEMIDELNKINADVPVKSNKSNLVDLYRKALRKFHSPKKVKK